MAKPNSITFALDTALDPSGPSVSVDAARVQVDLSRRDAMTLMSTVAAVPTVALAIEAPAFAAQLDRSPWNAVMSAYRECDATDEAFCEAESALIRTPAPDRDALLFKLERLFGEEALASEDGEYIPMWSKSAMNAVMADARRLLSIIR